MPSRNFGTRVRRWRSAPELCGGSAQWATAGAVARSRPPLAGLSAADSGPEHALAHLRPDLRGHGKSGHVSRGYRGTQYSDDIARFLRERVSAPAIIFGHSLGGMVGMWVAVHHPELVRALILGDNLIVAERIPSRCTSRSSPACAIWLARAGQYQ